MNKSLLTGLIRPLSIRGFSYKTVKRPDLSAKRKLTSPPEATDNDGKRDHLNLTAQIKQRILTGGPITMADYMKEVLTNPYAGYYMTRDVFGQEGDFITSPEISQIFGELVSVWCLSEWRKVSSPSPFQVVELGPGRGTLSIDVLKTLTHFNLGGQFSLHLVEVSPYLSKMQASRLCFKQELVDDGPCYMKGETLMGTKVFWYKRFEDVPRGFSIVLAHEFFDALPVHKFQKENGKWKEILIDVDTSKENGFRYILSKSETPMSKIFQPAEDDKRDCLEYSVETDTLIESMAERIKTDGGISLIMDYGHFGEKTDTFRAFKKHKLHDPLIEPGTADLTADVDFKRIKYIAEKNDEAIAIGPVDQGTFLKRMEGDARLEHLLENALPENKSNIKSGYEMLTDPKQMGSRFKFLSIFPAVLKDHLEKFPISGFN
ncbi:protein arginine methyltransferase NDUFAF7 homolog, mitochondrial [Episyrphus balteatus]|uniref:protein arginine methyltransferase NDUFAF7 homolog, mitochondrial n=1 Tax=Episyrphus balteatus TaxID=286459 RepID=UPI00248503F3|nr:protein arginine methyltransferase NDUFAF7 homolog, mitochondrial [Episyrphus balteatus]